MDLKYIGVKIIRKMQKDGFINTTRAVLKKVTCQISSHINNKRTSNFIKNLSSRKSIFIIMPIDWNHPLRQRPHHFAVEFSKIGYRAVYLTPNNIYDSYSDITTIKENLFIVPFKQQLVRTIKNSVVIFPSTHPFIYPETLNILKVNGNYVIYDYIDEISTEISGNINSMLRRHEYIKRNTHLVDLVTTVSLKLYNEMLLNFEKEKVMYLPNGCEFEHFSAISRDETRIPSKINQIVSQGKPLIGYYGAMASWLDYDLINTMAKSFPDINFLFIGPDYDGSIKKLAKLDNIHYIGPVDYSELPQYAVYFDVAIIPFKKGDIAKSTSPIKMYEYFALGKVVLYTEDLVECSLYDTPILVSRENMKQAIKKALELSKDIEYISKIKQEALRNTWQSRVEKIHNVLEESSR